MQKKPLHGGTHSRKNMIDFGENYNSADLERRALFELEEVYYDHTPPVEDKMMGFLENMNLEMHELRKIPRFDSYQPHATSPRFPHHASILPHEVRSYCCVKMLTPFGRTHALYKSRKVKCRSNTSVVKTRQAASA